MPGLGGTRVLDGNVGNTTQALGGLSASLWLHGRIPWWNPYAGAGLLLASTMQPGSFFMPFVLLLHLVDGPLCLKLTTQILSGLFTFACLRELGLRQAAAVIGGMLSPLTCTFAYFSDAPIMPIPFLPLLLRGIERCRAASSGAVLVAVSIGFSLMAGFPKTAAFDGLLGLAWLLLLLCARGGTMRARIGLAVRVCAGGLVGLLLASPAVIPFLRELPTSNLGPHGGNLDQVFRLDQLAGLLFPSIFGAPFKDFDSFAWPGPFATFGAVVTVLALVSLLSRPRDPRRWMLTIWILFFLFAVCGVPGFLFPAVASADPRSGRFSTLSGRFLRIRRDPAGRLRGRRLVARQVAQPGPDPDRPVGIPHSWRLVRDPGMAPSCRGRPSVCAAQREPCDRAAGGLFALPAHRLAAPPSVDVALRRRNAGDRRDRRAARFYIPVLHGLPDAPLDLAPISYLQRHAGLFGIAAIDDILFSVPDAWDRRVASLDPTQSGFHSIVCSTTMPAP